MAILRSLRGRANPFLLAFAVPMRSAVGAESNKRTVGRFSFCGLSPDPYSLPVSLFRGGGGGGSESERYPSAMYRSSSVTLSKRAVAKPWVLSLTVPRQAARRAVAFRSTNSGIIILSISRVRRRYAGTRRRRARVGPAWESAVINSRRKRITGYRRSRE